MGEEQRAPKLKPLRVSVAPTVIGAFDAFSYVTTGASKEKTPEAVAAMDEIVAAMSRDVSVPTAARQCSEVLESQLVVPHDVPPSRAEAV